MPITEILIRSISGYVFTIPGLLLYFIYLKKLKKKQTIPHIVTAFVFCYYLIWVLTMTGINSFEEFSPRIVFIPFIDMVKGPVDTILNVVLFLPLGFFMPLLYKKYNGIGRIAITSFLFSMSIEIIQMFGMGITDINDLITNTGGACFGYFIYKLVLRMVGKEFCEKFQANKIHDGKEILFFIMYVVLIMVTIQPLIIGSLFGLG